MSAEVRTKEGGAARLKRVGDRVPEDMAGMKKLGMGVFKLHRIWSLLTTSDGTDSLSTMVLPF